MSLFTRVYRLIGAKEGSSLKDFDSVRSTDLDAEKIKGKPVLKRIYLEKYRSMVEAMETFNRAEGGELLELGSGGGFFKDVLPQVTTSDCKALSYVDKVVDAESLPFEPESLRCIFGMQVFHHVSNARKFLKDAVRCLRPGGTVVLVEPNDGCFARWVFTRLHPEPFLADASVWEFEPKGPASGSNQALAYLVFKRDRDLFEREFPELEIVLIRPDTFLEYLVSGGVVYRQLLPDFCFPFLRLLDRCLRPLTPWLGLHQTIVLRKRNARGT